MSRSYIPLPPLWRLTKSFCLSNEYPTGLAWNENKAGYKKGEQAGRRNNHSGYYVVFVDNQAYAVHRIVYYMRTGIRPDNHDIKHSALNKAKDNRLELIATRKPRPAKRQATPSYA